MKIALSKIIYLVAILFLCGLDSWAIAPEPPEPPMATPPIGLDINSSIIFLLVAAIGYGAYVVIQKNKKAVLAAKKGSL